MPNSAARDAAQLAETEKSEKPQPPGKASETMTVFGNDCTIALPKTRIHTLEQLIAYFEIDTSIWECERFVANKWEVGMKMAATTEYYEGKRGKTPGWVRYSNKTVIEPLYQVKATFKRKVKIVSAKREIEELRKLAQGEAKKATAVKHVDKNTGYMLEVNIPDLHAGKLAWGVETGGENYDTKIAHDTFWSALETLLQRVASYKFESVVFVVGNDLLNSDNAEGSTTRGTKVSTDCRYHKTFGIVRNMMIEAVERLRHIAPVKVVMVSGNHDELSVWHLGDSLECFFHKYEDVTVDNLPRARKYHRFGNVMLMFTHGDKSKDKQKRLDYPLLMATEQPEMFGATKFRECHTGHTHLTKLDEKHGVRVRVLPALCAADAWHAENGYVGNLRNAEGYIWHRDEGLVGIAIYTKQEEGDKGAIDLPKKGRK